MGIFNRKQTGRKVTSSESSSLGHDDRDPVTNKHKDQDSVNDTTAEGTQGRL